MDKITQMLDGITPAPWEVFIRTTERGRQVTVKQSNKNLYVAKMDSDAGRFDRLRKNAAFIAAAPDLVRSMHTQLEAMAEALHLCCETIYLLGEERVTPYKMAKQALAQYEQFKEMNK